MTATILAVTGAPNLAVQELLSGRARRWRAAGLRVVGAVEVPRAGGPERILEDVATGSQYEIQQRLGPGSRACRLSATGIVEAGEAVRRQIIAGCDLVVLSKFGKLEAGRGGLVSAFTEAVSEGVPILTAVAPAFFEAWRLFSGDLAAYAPPSVGAIEAWIFALDLPHADPIGAAPGRASLDRRFR